MIRHRLSTVRLQPTPNPKRLHPTPPPKRLYPTTTWLHRARLATSWLSGTQIELYLSRVAGKNAYCLPYELASSITLFGKSSLRKRQLTKFRHLYGAVLRGDHWITIFVDLELSTFYYIDSFGTTSEAMQQAFANWLKFVKLRTDLLELQNEQPFAPVLDILRKY